MPTSPPTIQSQWRVLLFGPEATACGKSEVLLLTDNSALIVADLKAILNDVEPTLTPYLKSARFAVNQAFVNNTAAVRPEDEIALIGRVSGG